MANNIICVWKSSTGLIKGNVAITGYTDTVRLSAYPSVVIKNPFRPTRAGNRKLTNPMIPPITVTTPIGTAPVNAFQAMCNGNDIGTVTVTELDSDGANAKKVREITLDNVKIIDWRLQGDRDGGVCAFTMTSTGIKQTRAAIDQSQKAKGNTAATAKKGKQATK